MQQLGFESFVDLFAQPFHVDIHEVRAGIEIVVPDFFNDAHAAADAPGGAHQEFEQAKFARGEVEKFPATLDRKSTRLNSSHMSISYAVFCLKKKKKNK